MKIFHESHYTDILKGYLKANSHIRGYQSRLAEAAGVHNSYISRVVNERVHLTPDQAAQLCHFWNFSVDETDYFIALVSLARAGSKELKVVLKRQIESIRKGQEDLTRRYGDAQKLTAADQGLYYSAWYYSAIHFLLMIPGHQTLETISSRLNLPPALTASSLQSLEMLGLVRREGKKWQAVVSNMHMGNQSIWASIYHSCFRQRVAFKVHEKSGQDMHYTGLHPISESDFMKIKTLFQDTMEQVRSIALPSDEEELYCVCLDWFKI